MEFKTFNVVMHNDATYTQQLARDGRVSAEKVRELNRVIERNNPYLRTILREPTTGGNIGCTAVCRLAFVMVKGCSGDKGIKQDYATAG